jgi:hypothetical protein
MLCIILFHAAGLKSQSEPDLNREIEYSSKDIKLGKIRYDHLTDTLFDKSIEGSAKTICEPQYSTGCSEGDGFTDFAVAEIENYGSGCDNLNGTGWSQYFELGPAILLPGYSYDFFMSSGYGDQYVTIWIDFNNDEELSEDEKILSNYIMQSSGTLYTVQVEIPMSATLGQHIMRARTNWAAPSNDPCNNYTYGEAEDYYVVVGEAAFGSLEGTVTYLSNGSPAADATITITGLYSYSVSTGTDGTYLIENILQGDYSAVCSKEGYNSVTTSVSIIEDQTTTQDFQITQPTIIVDPLFISITLAPNTTGEEIVTIENNGNGLLDWSASLQITGKSNEDFMDLQFEYPVEVGGGEAGIETDGTYFYTSKWNGANFYKYDLDGNYLGSFTISGVSAIRDMAYDGNYFYGGMGLSTIYEMDFDSQTLISNFSAPTDCRAIAYNEDMDVFYANNWSSPIVKFDKAGNNLGSFNVGPVGAEYYGFAYDNATLGGPYLWGYAQVGDSKNEIIQIQLPSGTETGFTLDVATKLSGQLYNFAGGLFTYPNLVLGKWTLGGLVQNEWIWGLELADAQTWISISPNSGSLTGGNTQDISVLFDATELIPGVYEAEIYFTSTPNVGVPVVQVEMTIEGGPFIDNLTLDIICTDIILEWQVFPPGNEADSFRVYKDSSWISTTIETTYTDSLNYPETDHFYYITGFFMNGNYSFTTESINVSVPLPGSLEPQNLSFTVNGDEVVLYWNSPAACIEPFGYNLYRNNTYVDFTNDTTFIDSYGYYAYFVTAVYYFGESGPSNIAVITGFDENSERVINIFPNPVSENLLIVSSKEIQNMDLINLSGLTILTEKTGKETFEINVSRLEPGIYFIRLQTPEEIIIKKFIIE